MRRIIVFGGGNAVGAYHAGVYEAVKGAFEPDWIVGASIGAVTGALIVGNPPEVRLERIGQFWRDAELQPSRRRGSFEGLRTPAVPSGRFNMAGRRSSILVWRLQKGEGRHS